MRKGPYYTEDILVEKMQSGEYGWLDYVNHFSEEWQNEYEEYCKEHALCIGNESAEQFVKYKDELLEQGMETENCIRFLLLTRCSRSRDGFAPSTSSIRTMRSTPFPATR